MLPVLQAMCIRMITATFKKKHSISSPYWVFEVYAHLLHLTPPEHTHTHTYFNWISLPGQRSILSALLIMWIFKEEISCSRDWLHILFVTVCSLFMHIVWYIFEHTFFFCLISSMFDHILNIKCHKCQVKSSTALLIADVLQHRSVHLWLIKRVIKVWIETQRDPFFFRLYIATHI